MNVAGIILAAGASSRMGKPKALLEIRVGEDLSSPLGRLKSPLPQTLLSKQAELLHDAGCDPVVVVIGFDADTIIRSHPHLEVSWCINKDWQKGQFSSLQSGIFHILNLNPPTPPFTKGGNELLPPFEKGGGKPLPPFEKGGMGGILILPIDVVGVHHKTIESITKEAFKYPNADVIALQCEGLLGHPVFLSTEFAKHILTINIDDENARLDRQISNAGKVIRIAVNDPQILGNINTKEDWDGYLALTASQVMNFR